MTNTNKTTGRDGTVRLNEIARVRLGRTSAEVDEPERRRLVMFPNPSLKADPSHFRNRMTANTIILTGWMIILIMIMVLLELHIRSLTTHSFSWVRPSGAKIWNRASASEQPHRAKEIGGRAIGLSRQGRQERQIKTVPRLGDVLPKTTGPTA